MRPNRLGDAPPQFVDPSGFRQLRALVGRERITRAIEDRVCHSYDGTKQRALPDVVIWPDSTDHVAGVLAYANEREWPVYVRGAATGLSGGAVPLYGGIVMDMTRMNRISRIDASNLMAEVEPGVVTGQFQRRVEELGLFYPPDPASAEYSTVGGNVAECAGGLRGLKYGVTKHYVLGLEVVLADGSVLNTGARTLKNVTGYDLTQLLVGSEGTLGVITKILLKLIPLPLRLRTMMAFFHSAAEASDTALEIVAQRVLPRALEFMDRRSIKSVRDYASADIPRKTDALLLVEVDGTDESTKQEVERAVAACEKGGAFRVRVAETEAEREEQWSIRRAFSPALFTLAPLKLNEDVCVPRSEVTKLLRFVTRAGTGRPVTVACFGHIGDGNIHVNLLYEPGQEDEVKSIADGIFREVVRLGGTLSGEHGIGTSKAPFLEIELPPAQIEIMKSLKRLFDPKGILNPGKIFPDEFSRARRESRAILPAGP